MNKLGEELCRILDTTSLNLAVTEAIKKGKLTDTYLIVNGELELVQAFDIDSNTVYVSGEGPVTCESLDVFLPETGTYTLDKKAVSVTKKPVKSWKKSFCTGSNSQWCVEVVQSMPAFKMKDLLKAKRHKFILGESGVVFYNQKKVGLYDTLSNTMSCVNHLFYQDLLDFSNKMGLTWKET